MFHIHGQGQKIRLDIGITGGSRNKTYIKEIFRFISFNTCFFIVGKRPLLFYQSNYVRGRLQDFRLC